MLIEKIRSASQHEHTRLERTLFPYLERIETKDEYTRLLKAFYGYLWPVQQLVVKHIKENMMPDIGQRRNAALILGDLEELGANGDIVLCTCLPKIDSHAAALGALYVMEGSTLGGKIISGMISEKLGTNAALNFFNGYRENTGKMWKAFLANLASNENQDHNGTIVESVSETFSLFDKWLKEKLEKNDRKHVHEC